MKHIHKYIYNLIYKKKKNKKNKKIYLYSINNFNLIFFIKIILRNLFFES
jgi:hypothetical protein